MIRFVPLFIIKLLQYKNCKLLGITLNIQTNILFQYMDYVYVFATTNLNLVELVRYQK